MERCQYVGWGLVEGSQGMRRRGKGRFDMGRPCEGRVVLGWEGWFETSPYERQRLVSCSNFLVIWENRLAASGCVYVVSRIVLTNSNSSPI